MNIERKTTATITLDDEDIKNLACMLSFCSVNKITENISCYGRPSEQFGFTAEEISRANELFTKLAALANI